MQLHQDRLRAAGSGVVGGEDRRAGQEATFACATDELTGRGSVGPRHEDSGRPLGVAAVVLPLVDRAAPDRDAAERHVEQLEFDGVG